MPDRTRTIVVLLLMLMLLIAAAGFRLVVGDAAGWHWPESTAIFDARLGRLVSGCLVGSSLALAGVLLQSLLGNPLAAPSLMGVSSGANLGVAVAAYSTYLAGYGLTASPMTQTIAALAGALGALGIVLMWSHRRSGIDVVSMVLIGVIVSMIASGVSQLLTHLMPDRGFAATAWMLGSIHESLPAWMIRLATVGLGTGLIASLLAARSMDLASLGEDEARSLGVRMNRLRLMMFLVSGLLTTLAVMLAGPIGFVGLVVPHSVRMLIGPHHRWLILGSVLSGAFVIVAADASIAALPLTHGRLPLGIITTLIGGPVFLLLLRSTLSGQQR